jgi:hypothetical protein
MKWQDAAIVIAMISALLFALLALRPDSCRDGSAPSAEARQICGKATP